MSEHHLRIAKEFIKDRDYASARKVLNKIPEHLTAKKWLARIDEIEQQNQIRNQRSEPVELPLRLEVILRNHLNKNETVLWYEQPEPSTYSKYLNPNWMIAMYVVMGIALLVFQLYVQFGMSRGVSGVFLLYMVTLLVTPFIRIPIAYRRATTIHYILTDRQGFIVEKLKVIPIASRYASKIEVIEEWSGFKSVIFHRYSGWWSLIMIKIPMGFLGVSKADDVKRMIAQHWHSG